MNFIRYNGGHSSPYERQRPFELQRDTDQYWLLGRVLSWTLLWKLIYLIAIWVILILLFMGFFFLFYETIYVFRPLEIF